MYRIIGALLFVSCNNPFYSADCKCSSAAIQVQIIDESGRSLIPDSIQYKFENEDIEVIRKEANGTIYGDVGNHPGNYVVRVYYKGNVSDSIELVVGMGGPSDCRRPSTKKLTIEFKDNEYNSYELRRIGGCGE